MTFSYVLDETSLHNLAKEYHSEYRTSEPFPHVVIDNFLPVHHLEFFQQQFPPPSHSIWLDWKKRSPSQYGKQGPGNSDRFSSLDAEFVFALQEFNSWKFLLFLEELTGVKKLLPDPYFTGGGMHQILQGGILDIHTDFNKYERLDLYRRLNVLIYLNDDWSPSYGGELELWDGGKCEGKCIRSIPPIMNRAVIFQTDKNSFHGHPNEWKAPEPMTRRSIALYYYTATGVDDQVYDTKTDFQSVVVKPINQ